ncbi:hypothetical protein J2Y55_004584 [Bosea sp. BE125]|uniref:toll/interleukin-1 receptor domain-containing protein n=1 Tax=Bosea sp. BE125 TaxID=2817909 RepID=UPI0028555849|nr:toll/interleukin-1 receptor domain-containing protein [Bosea sp. BE125]MDR6873557.1 hypothetical protein [Bosea sp. BE125]
MSTFTENFVRTRAKRETLVETASAKLNRSAKSAPSTQKYDIFLSHSIKDAELVLGVKLILEDAGRTVYVDWLEDRQMDRSHVTPATAEKIRERMRSCRSLIYLHSENATQSKWMPWELGFSDGLHGAVAILPVTKSEQNDFQGQEYIGIYPWVDNTYSYIKSVDLRIHNTATIFKDWSSWVSSPRSIKMV